MRTNFGPPYVDVPYQGRIPDSPEIWEGVCRFVRMILRNEEIVPGNMDQVLVTLFEGRVEVLLNGRTRWGHTWHSEPWEPKVGDLVVVIASGWVDTIKEVGEGDRYQLENAPGTRYRHEVELKRLS